MQDVVDSGLEGNEYVTLLSWVLNTYPGTELMGSSELNIDVSTLPPLLSEESLQKLQDEYLQVTNTTNLIGHWSSKAQTFQLQPIYISVSHTERRPEPSSGTIHIGWDNKGRKYEER